jgi:hypothetical protein
MKYDKNGKLLQKHRPLGGRQAATKDVEAIKAEERRLAEHMALEDSRSRRGASKRIEVIDVPAVVHSSGRYLEAIIERLDRLIEQSRPGK